MSLETLPVLQNVSGPLPITRKQYGFVCVTVAIKCLVVLSIMNSIVAGNIMRIMAAKSERVWLLRQSKAAD